MAEALRAKGVPFAHYVFPSGFHGLSYPSDEFFDGYNGGTFVLEQLEKAVAAVKAGKGINVSDQRKKELEEQFPDAESKTELEEESEEDSKEEQDMSMLPPIDRTWIEDIGLWPELARVWMNRL
jgi:hypothetical protein